MSSSVFHLSRYPLSRPGADDTRRIQAALDDAAAAGGGRVVVPAGEYRCGPLQVRSGVHLSFEEGARILGVWQGQGPWKGLVHASRARDIRITGPGVVDGRGDVGRFPHKNMPRPRGFFISECENVVVEDLTFRNAASWGLHFALCRDVTIEGVTVYNHTNRNNDGIDICDCHRVRVLGCDVSSDDDGICIKSFTDRGSCDIEVADCTVASHCNAIKTGTESFGVFRNIHIHDCRVVRAKSDEVYYGSAEGQSAVCITNVDGAVLEDIRIHDLTIESGTRIPIFLKLGARLRPYRNDAPKPVGVCRRVSLERITATGSRNSPYACVVAGVSAGGRTYYVEDIALRDIALHFVGAGPADAEIPPEDEVPENADAYPHPRRTGFIADMSEGWS